MLHISRVLGFRIELLSANYLCLLAVGRLLTAPIRAVGNSRRHLLSGVKYTETACRSIETPLRITCATRASLKVMSGETSLSP